MSDVKPVPETPAPWSTEPPPPKTPARRSTLSCLLLGCGSVLLVLFLLCGGASLWGFRWVTQSISDFAGPFEARGYERQTAQVVEVKESPAKNTVYVAQVLKVSNDVNVDLAVICQVMELKADLHGDLDFFGQVLKVDRGCVIHGDLRIKTAQVVEVNGEVTGTITGQYMVLKYRGKQYLPGQPIPGTPAEPAEDPAGEPLEAGASEERPGSPAAPVPAVPPTPSEAPPAAPVPAVPPTPSEAPPAAAG